MDIRNVLFAVIAALGVSTLAVKTANADTVLYEGTGFLQGQQSFTKSFDITGPGVVTVTMTNISWPEKLASLNFLLSTANGLSGPEMGEGVSQFNVDGGRFFAQWFGQAQGALNLGVYGMKIEFQPSATVVPLPTSIVLLLSGLGLLAWQRRSQGTGGLDCLQSA